jgi:hypothetical protein
MHWGMGWILHSYIGGGGINQKRPRHRAQLQPAANAAPTYLRSLLTFVGLTVSGMCYSMSIMEALGMFSALALSDRWDRLTRHSPGLIY